MASLGDSPFSVLTLIAAPALLTNTSSVLLLSTGNRFARALDRARALAAKLEARPDRDDPVARFEMRQLSVAEHRVLLIVRALTSFYVAVGAFAGSSLVALLGAGFLPQEQAQVMNIITHATLAAGVLGVGALIYGAALLVWESRLSYGVLREEAEMVRERHIHVRQLDKEGD